MLEKTETEVDTEFQELQLKKVGKDLTGRIAIMSHGQHQTVSVL